VQLSQNWAQLSKEEREPYKLKAKEDRERYKRDMVKYEKKMTECEEEMYDKAMEGDMKPASVSSKPKSSKSGKKNKKAPSHDEASMALEESAARSAKAKHSRGVRAKKRQARSGTSSEVASMVPSLGGGTSEVAGMVPSLPSLPAIGGGGGKPATAALSLAVTRSDSSMDAQQDTSDNEGNDVLAV